MSMLGASMAANKNFFAGTVSSDELVNENEKLVKPIIRGTFAIDPTKIEKTASLHDDVDEAAAIGRPSRYTGEVPVLYVTLKPGALVQDAGNRVHAFLNESLTDRFSIPVEVRVLPKLPKTTTGHIFKPYLAVKEAEEMIQPVVERYLMKKEYKLSLNLSKDMQVKAQVVIAEGIDYDLNELETDIDALPINCEVRYS